ncbi:MAG: FMN-binding protein [Candidatus Margulisbacteria bacterium]|nr:FMN-binding protein [Candidatus Margulisiibacteriota bacterium]
MGKIFKLGIILAVFCVISAGGLAIVYMYTQPKIVLNSQLALEGSKKAVLPPSGKGQAIAVSPRGYGGPIEMLVGVDPVGKVSGVKILSQRETPGLGANIVKPKFLDQFKGKSLKDPLEPKKDIDAITGATISSRAVCVGVKEALRKAK